ncbi:MAG: polysaccharide deacetylase family protein [Ilumatobacter fluminis]|uniref:polysaccharide deacetylase family protein n=1 Tax=Ilumatobacter fluminis TaxID=467091 RepID=UPI0032EB5773
MSERRRLPRRYLVVAAFVFVVAASERFGGPLTVDAVRGAVSSGTEAAADQLRYRNARGEIHLTFDDGPTPAYTDEILELLDRYDAEAVFFPIGEQVEPNAALLERAVDDGHRLGNHTWAHDRLADLTAWEFDAAVGRTQIAVGRATGTVPTCLRPPEGVIDDAAADMAAAEGLSVELWTLDPLDWQTDDADAIARRVIDGAADGAVVLLHDGGGDRDPTVDALGTILRDLSRDGYRFTVLPGC